jgi:hypothetical protein
MNASKEDARFTRGRIRLATLAEEKGVRVPRGVV